jgi:hypothetical protein
MARYAIVKDGIVSNIVLYDGVGEFSVDGDLIVADENTYIGGAYADGVFAPAPIPEDVSTYASNRRYEYPSLDDLIVALWEGVVEERMASVTALEGVRQAVKAKYPK